MPWRVAPSSTFDGRCNVRVAKPRGERPRSPMSESPRRRLPVSFQRVDHDVADEMNPIFGDALIAQVLIGQAVGGEQ